VWVTCSYIHTSPHPHIHTSTHPRAHTSAPILLKTIQQSPFRLTIAAVRADARADDDWAAAIVAANVDARDDARVLLERSKSYRNMWNAETGFMEAKNSDGSWAGPNAGWTEGDHWAYSLTVMVRRIAALRSASGITSFVRR
jgi:hypothetical protein